MEAWHFRSSEYYLVVDERVVPRPLGPPLPRNDNLPRILVSRFVTGVPAGAGIIPLLRPRPPPRPLPRPPPLPPRPRPLAPATGAPTVSFSNSESPSQSEMSLSPSGSQVEHLRGDGGITISQSPRPAALRAWKAPAADTYSSCHCLYFSPYLSFQ